MQCIWVKTKKINKNIARIVLMINLSKCAAKLEKKIGAATVIKTGVCL